MVNRRKRTICQKQHDFLRRLGLTVLAVGLLASQAQADTTQTWTLTASCDETTPTCVDPSTISATFTTQMVTGMYVDPSGEVIPELLTEPLIETLTGTYDGQAMTLGASEFGAWMDTLPNVMFPQMLYFSAGNQTYLLFWDGSPNLEIQSNYDEILSGVAVDPVSVSESPMLPTLLAGFVAVLWLYRRKILLRG